MASAACDGYCCVAKRFDRPFSLPSSSTSAPAAGVGTADDATGAAAAGGGRLSLTRQPENAAANDASSDDDGRGATTPIEERTEDAPSAQALLEAAPPPPHAAPVAINSEDGEDPELETTKQTLRDILDALLIEGEGGGAGGRAFTHLFSSSRGLTSNRLSPAAPEPSDVRQVTPLRCKTQR